MKMLIIKTGNTFPEIAKKYGDFEDWIIRGTKYLPDNFIITNVQNGEKMLPPTEFDGVFITGSHANVTEKTDWIEYTAEWLRNCVSLNIPVLGICFGHQLLAYAFGGKVDFHPLGTESGTVSINLTKAGKADKLLGFLPFTFTAQVNHSQTVISLPDGAEVLAYNSFEPHHAFSYKNNAWGLQFHPEFTPVIMLRYLECEKSERDKKGIDSLQLIKSLDESDLSRIILRRFAEYAMSKKKELV